MIHLYILNSDHEIIPCIDMHAWAEWYEQDHNRRVEKTIINDYSVSTIFLGTDYNPFETGNPILFETMIYNIMSKVPLHYLERYSTWDKAKAGHQKAIEWVNERLKHVYI